MLYKTYIHPNLEYSVPIWNPYLAKNIDKLECVQHRATKLVPHLPYEERLKHLDLYSLYCCRHRGNLIEVYKLINHCSRSEFHQTHFSLFPITLQEAMIKEISSNIVE